MDIFRFCCWFVDYQAFRLSHSFYVGSQYKKKRWCNTDSTEWAKPKKWKKKKHREDVAKSNSIFPLDVFCFLEFINIMDFFRLLFFKWHSQYTQPKFRAKKKSQNPYTKRSGKRKQEKNWRIKPPNYITLAEACILASHFSFSCSNSHTNGGHKLLLTKIHLQLYFSFYLLLLLLFFTLLTKINRTFSQTGSSTFAKNTC